MAASGVGGADWPCLFIQPPPPRRRFDYQRIFALSTMPCMETCFKGRRRPHGRKLYSRWLAGPIPNSRQVRLSRSPRTGVRAKTTIGSSSLPTDGFSSGLANPNKQLLHLTSPYLPTNHRTAAQGTRESLSSDVRRALLPAVRRRAVCRCGWTGGGCGRTAGGQEVNMSRRVVCSCGWTGGGCGWPGGGCGWTGGGCGRTGGEYSL